MASEEQDFQIHMFLRWKFLHLIELAIATLESLVDSQFLFSKIKHVLPILSELPCNERPQVIRTAFHCYWNIPAQASQGDFQQAMGDPRYGTVS